MECQVSNRATVNTAYLIFLAVVSALTTIFFVILGILFLRKIRVKKLQRTMSKGQSGHVHRAKNRRTFAIAMV